MHDADKSPVKNGPRNRSVHIEKITPLLWEPEPCCDAKGYKPEVKKNCQVCDAEPWDLSATCTYCGACTHCGAELVDERGRGARHLCTFKMMHNGHEWRTQWMVRVKAETPGAEKVSDEIWMIEIWLDVGLEPDLFSEVAWSTRKEEILRGAEMTAEEQEQMLDGTLNERLK
jgi:hypothetical protein